MKLNRTTLLAVAGITALIGLSQAAEARPHVSTRFELRLSSKRPHRSREHRPEVRHAHPRRRGYFDSRRKGLTPPGAHHRGRTYHRPRVLRRHRWHPPRPARACPPRGPIIRPVDRHTRIYQPPVPGHCAFVQKRRGPCSPWKTVRRHPSIW
jgi:hypothetical protein